MLFFATHTQTTLVLKNLFLLDVVLARLCTLNGVKVFLMEEGLQVGKEDGMEHHRLPEFLEEIEERRGQGAHYEQFSNTTSEAGQASPFLSIREQFISQIPHTQWRRKGTRKTLHSCGAAVEVRLIKTPRNWSSKVGAAFGE